jgi:hypothetical protein
MMEEKVDQLADAISETKCLKSSSNIPSSSMCAAVRGTSRSGLALIFAEIQLAKANNRPISFRASPGAGIAFSQSKV